jgi:hypothetical protein
MADEKNHPLVDLMLERMKSHPEEFEGEGNRWVEALVAIHQWAAPEQREQVDRAIGDIRLDKAYNEAMDELLNGEQRRAEAKAEEEAAIAAKNAALQHQMLIAKQQMAQRMQQDHDNALLSGLGQYAQAGSTLGSLHGLNGNSHLWTITDEVANIQPTSLKLGGETLDEGMIKRMKKALGL